MKLTILDFGVIGAYFLGMLLFGVLVRRIRSFADYAVGERATPSAMIFASLAATYIGPGYTIGFTAKGFTSGFLFFFVALAFTLQTVLVAFFIAPRLHQHKDCFTIGDVMGKVYGRGTQLATGLTSLLLSVGFVAIMAKVGGLVLQGTTGLPLWMGAALVTGVGILYTFTGGIKAVIATDSIQFVIFGITVPALILFAVGMSKVDFGKAGEFGWQAMSDSVHDLGGLQVLGLFVSFFLGETLIPPYANRAFAAGSGQIARSGFLAAAAYSIVWFGMVIGLGILARFATPSVNADDAFMAMATTFLPAGLVGLVIVAIAAVIMSSQESVLNAGSVSFTRDLLGPLGLQPRDDSMRVRVTKGITLAVGVLASVLALHAPSIIDGLLVIYSLWAPSVLPVFVLALLLPRPSAKAGLPALLAGACVSLSWQFLLGSPMGLPPILVGLAANVLVFLTLSLAFRVPPTFKTVNAN